MGIMKFFSRPPAMPMRLPSGCFTVDRSGEIVASTVPQSFPPAIVDEIARAVLATFSGAQAVSMPFTELSVHYASFKIVARELRGGAIVFLTPQTIAHTQN
jgi:hypothetical protein